MGREIIEEMIQKTLAPNPFEKSPKTFSLGFLPGEQNRLSSLLVSAAARKPKPVHAAVLQHSKKSKR